MSGLDMLDVAIGVIFVYLLLSLICSAVNEIIEAFLKQRAFSLENGIREMLEDSASVEKVTANVKNANNNFDKANKKLADTLELVNKADADKTTAKTELDAAQAAKIAAQTAVDTAGTDEERTAANNNFVTVSQDFDLKTATFNAAQDKSNVAHETLSNDQKAFETAKTDKAAADDAFAKSANIVEKLYNHPLISSLFQGDFDTAKKKFNIGENANATLPAWKGTLPSYIPSANFALALMDLLAPQKNNSGDKIRSLDAVRNEVVIIQNDKIKNALLPLIDAASNNIDEARANIEQWYDSTMDRVSGLYKRRVQYFILALGLITAGAINADTIAIVNGLIHDPAERTALISTVQEYAKEHPSLPPPVSTPTPVPTPTTSAAGNTSISNSANIGSNNNKKTSPSVTPTPSVTPKNTISKGTVSSVSIIKAAFTEPTTGPTNSPVITPSATPKPSPSMTPDPCKVQDSADCKLAENLGEIRSLGLPIGWANSTTNPLPTTLVGWLIKIFGWIITGIAISLGAPFWFDVLNKFMIVRSTVKPKEKSPDEKSKA